MDGVYEVKLPTKMGNIDARINIVTNNGTLSGYLEAMGKKSAFSGGKVNGNKFDISGKVSSLFMKISYYIEGEVVNGMLMAHATTNMGNFDVKGKKVG